MLEYLRIPARKIGSGCIKSLQSDLGRSWQTASISFTQKSTRQLGTWVLSNTWCL
jgi:hypothetical protein